MLHAVYGKDGGEEIYPVCVEGREPETLAKQAAAEIRGEELGNVGFFGAENLRCHVNAGKKNVSVTYEADTIAGFGGFKWTLKTEGSSKVIQPVKWIRRIKAAKEAIGITRDQDIGD